MASTAHKAVKIPIGTMLRRANFDWKNLILTKDSGTVLEFTYPLPPKFFLKAAKQDLTEGGERGAINALSNAKRAIDCQTDTFISAIGLSPKDLSKQLGKDVIDSLGQFISNTEQPLKFRVLESLGIVTPAIVGRVRRIRNLLEHQYKKPSTSALRDAIDVSSLYVSACEGALNTFLDAIYFESHDALDRDDGRLADRTFKIELNWRRPRLEVAYSNSIIREHATRGIKPTEASYLGWLRVLFAARAQDDTEKAIAVAASMSGYPLEAKNIRIKLIRYA